MPKRGETHVFIKREGLFYCYDYENVVLSRRSELDVQALVGGSKIIVGTIESIEDGSARINILKILK